MLTAAFETAATLGDVPWILVGDLNTNPELSPVLGTLCGSQQTIDLGAPFDSGWTYQKGQDVNIRTRIDHAICNRAMLPHVSNMTVLRDTNLPGHCPLRIQLDFPEHLDYKFVYRSPQSVEVNHHLLKQTEHDRIEADLWSKLNPEFSTAIRNHDVNTACNIWTRTAEQFIIQLSSGTFDFSQTSWQRSRTKSGLATCSGSARKP